jgi:RecB family endonuclease NucS
MYVKCSKKLSEKNMPSRRPVLVYENPSIEEAEEAVRSATSGRKTLIVAGNCWVEYQGRASSTLEPGERILILKEDGSVLVHRPKGYEPVNWQPPGSVFYTSSRKGELTIKAVRRKPHEAITVHFDYLRLVSVLSLVDEGEFSLYASEEDMQRAILLQPSIVEDGLKLITYEKKVEPGFIDVYGIDAKGRMVIIEIKRKTAGKEAALQLAKYVNSVKNTVNREIRGILVAPQLAKGAQKLLVTLGLNFKQLDPRKCSEIIRETETKKLVEFY